MRKFLILCLAILPLGMWGQSGYIKGLVQDKDFQEPLPFANVLIEGSTEGTTTDFDGLYTLELSEGTYTLIFSFVGYESVRVENVNVIAGATEEVNLSLGSAAEQMEEVVVTVQALRNSEQAVLAVQKKSANLLDGISSQNFKKIGASDLANAIKNVPGVSVQGGKYVYVRGLGDRYTKSILNGMDIPGLDPDRNSIQMDIFPSGIIDNVMVLKSATAEYPADFTGGIVDIITKDIPAQKNMSFSYSMEYNPRMHFQSGFLKQNGSSTDIFGFDSQTRDLPVSSSTEIPSSSQGNEELTRLTQSFNPELAPLQTTSPLNFSASFNYGNQFQIGDKQFGLVSSIAYDKDFEYYDDFEASSYIKNTNNTSDLNLLTNRTQVGEISTQNVLLSGLLGLSLKGELSKYKLNVLHLQNGVSTAAKFRESNFIYGSNTLVKDVMDYNQKSVTNILLTGKHYFQEGSFTLEWKLSPTINKNYDKDIRVTPFRVDDGGFEIEPSESGDPLRIWRYLDEVSYVSKVDAVKEFQLFERNAKFKAGLFRSLKTRDFNIENFLVKIKRRSQFDFSEGNPNTLFLDSNIWTAATNQGTYIARGSGEADQFSSAQINYSGYLSQEFQPIEKLRAIIGLRIENYRQKFRGIDQNDVQIRNQTIINETDFFPSVNLVYSSNDKVNLRASFAQTVARPSFKEVSNAQIFDPLNNRFFIGNLDLVPSYINNFDIRYERFDNPGEIIAFSAFYKTLKDPIELVTFSASAPDNFTPRNMGEATVIGTEVEIRKNLGVFADALKYFNLNFNGSLIEAELKMDQSPGGEYESRTEDGIVRDGETVPTTRDLQGQSPFLINTGINYSNTDLGLDAGLYFNTQGRTLQVVGIGEVPDVYTMPFNSLNLNASYTFGELKNSTISLKVKNLLNDDRLSQFISYGDESKIFSRRSLGTAISLGYSYKF